MLISVEIKGYSSFNRALIQWYDFRHKNDIQRSYKYGCPLLQITDTDRMKKNLQKSAWIFGTKSKAYLQIGRPIFGYFWLFLPICESSANLHKSPQIYFAFRAKNPCLFLPIFRHLTCENSSIRG